MRWNHFGGSLVFSALAAACLPAAWLLLGPVMGRFDAIALTVVATSSLYLVGIAPSLRRGIPVALAAGGVGLVVLCFAHSLREVAIASAVIVAVARSGVLYRARPLRALALELGLTMGGLGLAGFLAGRGPLELALALWGYLLVQSCFFLVAGVHERAPVTGPDDPFDRARIRLLSLLEEDPV